MFCVLFQSPLTILLLLLHFVLILKKKKKMEKVYQCVVCDLEYGAKEILLDHYKESGHAKILASLFAEKEEEVKAGIFKIYFLFLSSTSFLLQPM